MHSLRDRFARTAVPAAIASSIALALALWWRTGLATFCLDDAYIHLAYARSLQLGEGFSYNPNDWELGESSPLWTLLLALLPAHLQTVSIITAFGSALHALGTALTCVAFSYLTDTAGVLATRPWTRAAAALVSGLLVATNPVLLQGSVSGMEVPLAVVLLLGTLIAMLSRSFMLSALLAALSVWTRPESLVACGLIALLGMGLDGEIQQAFRSRSMRSALTSRNLSAAIAATAAMLCWMLYCQIAHGHFFPNTHHVKGRANIIAGLNFIRERVLGEEPWLMSVGGVIVLLLLLLRNPKSVEATHNAAPVRLRTLSFALLGGWAVLLLAVAFTRALDASILFYLQRYFAIFAFLPPLAIALSVVENPKRMAWLVTLIPCLAIVLPPARQLVHAQAENIRLENVNPAHWIAAHLPANAVVLLSDAGALRYYTPRTLRMIDVVGLNNERKAYAPPGLGLCALLAEHPTHIVMPAQVLGASAQAFRLEMLAEFVDPAYAQNATPSPRTVVVARIESFHPEAVAMCRERFDTLSR